MRLAARCERAASLALAPGRPPAGPFLKSALAISLTIAGLPIPGFGIAVGEWWTLSDFLIALGEHDLELVELLPFGVGPLVLRNAAQLSQAPGCFLW